MSVVFDRQWFILTLSFPWVYASIMLHASEKTAPFEKMYASGF